MEIDLSVVQAESPICQYCQCGLDGVGMSPFASTVSVVGMGLGRKTQ